MSFRFPCPLRSSGSNLCPLAQANHRLLLAPPLAGWLVSVFSVYMPMHSRSCDALSVLDGIVGITPRALPWAVLWRPFRPDYWRLARRLPIEFVPEGRWTGLEIAVHRPFRTMDRLGRCQPLRSWLISAVAPRPNRPAGRPRTPQTLAPVRLRRRRPPSAPAIPPPG